MGTGVAHDLRYSETTRPMHPGCLRNIPVSGGGLTGWFVMSDLNFLAPGPSRGGGERRVMVFTQGLPHSKQGTLYPEDRQRQEQGHSTSEDSKPRPPAGPVTLF